MQSFVVQRVLHVDSPCLSDLLLCMLEGLMVHFYAFILLLNLTSFTFFIWYKFGFEKDDFLIFEVSLFSVVSLKGFLLVPYPPPPLCPEKLQCGASVVWIICWLPHSLYSISEHGMHVYLMVIKRFLCPHLLCQSRQICCQLKQSLAQE